MPKVAPKIEKIWRTRKIAPGLKLTQGHEAIALDAPLSGLNAPSKSPCLALEILGALSRHLHSYCNEKKCPMEKVALP